MQVCDNATELYLAMNSAILQEQWGRQTTDLESVQPALTYEAKPGCEFELRAPIYNIQTCVAFDRLWARAHLLHFFAGTEEAKILEKYNKHATKYIVDGVWHGAYGAIAMPQIAECINRLRSHPSSRRAIVSMGAHNPQDMHRPACWSFLQFLNCRSGLCMLVCQRSLNLAKIMQYDLVVLSNILAYVAEQTGISIGSLIWSIGSLHTLELRTANPTMHSYESMMLKVHPSVCLQALHNPVDYPEVWR